MPLDRRRFLRLGSTGALAAAVPSWTRAAGILVPPASPVVLSTWDHGLAANRKAWQVLSDGGNVLDAVVEGVAVVENDLGNRTVGQGGRPDRDGHVTLDACVQDHDGRAGSVAFVEHFPNPVRIARAVMERTPHVMLVGEGAERWARENGFAERRITLPGVQAEWKEWTVQKAYQPVVNIENHDTIGQLAVDARGRLAGSCTTSGMAYKVHGRVGDSPIIGAGLFVDGEVGAACATGTGELVIRIAGSHTVVEMMRQGVEPTEACRQAVERIVRRHRDLDRHQVGFLALRADGAFGAFSLRQGFTFAVSDAAGHRLLASEHMG
ncbi:MAG: N(4)-(beta-N-acetylglucosaminyl)-L-asparaginase [Flavobacteriales bacterium]|nr:N(4)-(Beta-N-acetylglucosaminyl)-L-asparaginase [Flavobacteriales bacterium]MCC6578560.1 N(4)-(beta-N-acetylglucosaminyl)-L-asparaginase [Flavobacteriales bacterium]NUQ16374.1 N(4)-(beta-N-acetylglucosaminyl)-L-asparaginase [Flavobacteriales bacterium]